MAKASIFEEQTKQEKTIADPETTEKNVTNKLNKYKLEKSRKRKKKPHYNEKDT